MVTAEDFIYDPGPHLAIQFTVWWLFSEFLRVTPKSFSPDCLRSRKWIEVMFNSEEKPYALNYIFIMEHTMLEKQVGKLM